MSFMQSIKRGDNLEEVKNNGNKFTPSYKKNNNKKEEKNIKIDKRKIIFLLSFAVILILVISILSIVISNIKYKKYYEFEDVVSKYGFDEIYDNKTANTKDKITKSEVVKIVVSSVYNTSDIEGISGGKIEEEYSNSMWVEFAQRMGIITTTDVNASNANEYATYSDVIRYFTNAKSKVLKLDLDTEDKGVVKDINKYNMDEKFGILDMVNSEVITKNTSKINARKNVFKGQVNEIIKNFVEKYNTITIQNEKLNINEDKIPTNESDYPYTVISVDKEAYEIEFSGKDNVNFKSPAKLFREQKEYYYQIKNNTENYYNYLLNIDYITISEERLKKDLRRYLLFDLNDEDVKKYVKYVKDNKIKLSGSAKVQLPAIYFDGTYYRVRTKIDFKVESSNTDKNLLFLDIKNSNNKIYKDKEYSFYIDTYMSNAYGNKTLYNVQKSIYEMLAEPLKSKIEMAGE